MKKAKLFTVIISAVILCTATVLSMCLFTGMRVQAADAHAHPVCGATCAHTGEDAHTPITFTEWSTADAMPTEAGNYVLTVDVTVAETWYPVDGITLCLNGKTLKTTSGSVIFVNENITFTLCECQATPGKITGGSGTALASFWNYVCGGGILVNGTFNMYGGEITQNGEYTQDGYVVERGGGVAVFGTFNMYDGKITDNKASSGAGIYVYEKTKFYMYDGSISDNTSFDGGGMYIYYDNNEIYIYGGELSNNTASSSGGAIHGDIDGISNVKLLNNSANNIGGAVYGILKVMSDCVITGNSAGVNGGNGGGLYIRGDSSITRCVISGNTASNSGGGIYVNGGKCTISDCEITNNTAVTSGGGVQWNVKNIVVNVSGNTKIKGNTVGGNANNVYLLAERKITVGTLGADAEIGITLAADYSGSFSVGGAQYASAFSDDSGAMDIVTAGSDLKLVTLLGGYSQNGIQGVEITPEGKLLITLYDGTVLDGGTVPTSLGEKGDKGDKGDTGATGDRGEKGDVGEVGAQGEKGDKGDKGENGMDGRHAENVKVGLSGGAVAAITIASIVVAELLAFALIWFVFKKKSFADLAAVFKK